MQANSNTQTLRQVSERYQQLIVSDYQRSYSWQREQIDELLSDLFECTKHDVQSHFLGTLILQERPEDRSAEIVDGQQRLTTCFMIVACLRDNIKRLPDGKLSPSDPDSRDIDVLGIAEDFLLYSTSYSSFRLLPSRFVRDLMNKYVFSSESKGRELPKKDKEVTLAFRKGVKIVRSVIEADIETYFTPEHKLRRIHSLLETLLTKFVLLVVTTTSTNQSLDIFLTLNNRGLPLGPSDLVRGELMKTIGGPLDRIQLSDLQAKMLHEWEEMVEQVKDPEVFLRHYLVSESTAKVQKRKVFDVVQRLVAKNSDSNDDDVKTAKQFWSNLNDAAAIYNKIISASTGCPDTDFYLNLLDGLVKSHRIMLLKVLSADLDTAQRRAIVRLVFVLSYRWTLAGDNAQQLEDFYQRQCSLLSNADDYSALISNLRHAIGSVQLNVKEELIPDADKSFVTKALLASVNRHLSHGANEYKFDRKVHIEHIAPKATTDEWISKLHISDGGSDYDSSTIVSSIGNLTLLDEGLNKQASCRPYDEKKLRYEKSNYIVTRDLTKLGDWTADTINARSEWLAEMFDEVFQFNDPINVVPFSDWYNRRNALH